MTAIIVKSALIGTSCACLAACANTSHVLVYQHSNFGLNAGLNPATQSTHIRVGMRNEFAIITPRLQYEGKFAELDDQGQPIGPTESGTGYKAASSYVAARFRVSDPFKAPEVAEIVATGKAATSVGEMKGSSAFLSQ